MWRGGRVTASQVISSSIRHGSVQDFERLWAFVERHALFQAGFTILTPLPGTEYFEKMRPMLRPRKWSDFDMHHLLWQPALGAERFFELYCETWRRSVLNLRGRKSIWKWLERSRSAERDVSVARAEAHTAHDGSGALSRRMRLRIAAELVYRVVCGGCAKVPGAIGALGTTSSSVISFVSPPANVMRIAVEQQRRVIDPQIEQRQPLANLLPLRHQDDMVGAGALLGVGHRDVEALAQLVGISVDKIFLNAALHLPDVSSSDGCCVRAS